MHNQNPMTLRDRISIVPDKELIQSYHLRRAKKLVLDAETVSNKVSVKGALSRLKYHIL